MGSGSSLYKQHNAGVEILEKMWTKICVQPMTKTELGTVIITRHPQLETVVDKLLDIYLLLSAGSHQVEEASGEETEEECGVGRFLARDGRLISTRYFSPLLLFHTVL